MVTVLPRAPRARPELQSLPTQGLERSPLGVDVAGQKRVARCSAHPDSSSALSKPSLWVETHHLEVPTSEVVAFVDVDSACVK